MAGRKTEEIRDPKALRALAHPMRWKLMRVLGDEDSATATRCAEVLEQSVASCSYHLNILAKYGFIEQVPDSRGREKPWRMTVNEQRWSAEGLDIEGTLAAEAASDAFLQHEFAQIQDRERRRGAEPAEWRRVVGLTGITAFLTAAEVRQVRDDINQLMLRYDDRVANPDLRPADARSVRFFLHTSVAPNRPPAS